MPRAAAPVTICVPAYQAAEFIGETLATVERQTFENWRASISVDRSSDGTEEACRAFARDPRFEIVTQPERLGWAGNMNALLDRVATEFYVILPHDDRLDERYLATLLPELEADAATVNVYSDIELFGEINLIFPLELAPGAPFERMLSFLLGNPSGVPLRGPTRSWPLRRGLRFPENRFESFLAGVVYVLDLLRFGTCRRIAQPLYRKWVRPGSVERADWMNWSWERRRAAWTEHTRDCLQAIATSELEAQERQALEVACLARHLRWPHRFGGEEDVPLGSDDLLAIAPTIDRALLLAAAIGELPAERPASAPMRRAVARVRLREGIEHRRRGDLPAAQSCLASAVELDPLSADALLEGSETLAGLGRLEEAIDTARRAAELAPEDPRRLAHLARLLARASPPPDGGAGRRAPVEPPPPRPAAEATPMAPQAPPSPGPLFPGFYAAEPGDRRWMSRHGWIVVPPARLPAQLRAELRCSEPSRYDRFPFAVSVAVPGRPRTVLCFDQAHPRHTLVIDLPPAERGACIELASDASFCPARLGESLDERELSVELVGPSLTSLRRRAPGR